MSSGGMFNRQDIDSGRKAAGKEPVGLERVKRQGPHPRAGQTGIDAIPCITLVRRAENAASRILADHDLVGIGWIESNAAIVTCNESAASKHPAPASIRGSEHILVGSNDDEIGI